MIENIEVLVSRADIKFNPIGKSNRHIGKCLDTPIEISLEIEIQPFVA